MADSEIRASMTVTPTFEDLIPYSTRTATQTPFPPDPSTSTPLPSPTPTPLIHIVSKGEDMFGIAFRYGIPLEELMAANPDVNARLLSVGMELIVPYVEKPSNSEDQLPTPTPAGVQVEPTQCYRNAAGGIWCFAVVHNDLPVSVESVTGIFRLVIEGQEGIISRSATTLLNVIHSGERQPVLVYFPPDQMGNYQASFELTSALEIPPEDDRYLSGQIENLEIDFQEDGTSVALSGELIITGESALQTAWVAAAAYDQAGRIVGARRWEGGESSGQFDFKVYSLAGDIAYTEIWFEARP
ncbi:MAG: LysM peptidoglycan-binding domain-containing protein [Anaerolineaceae bacterium]|nr:LysM peptidoglycan-binding domain-containing protein [Anaerolineaceae bacterium]